MEYKHAPVSVVETAEFVRESLRIMSEAERHSLVTHLAYKPQSGDLIPDTGGVRKLRWKLENKGKRGGARVIYYFYDHSVPLFALTMFAKNERTDLTQGERNAMRQIVATLIESYGGGSLV